MKKALLFYAVILFTASLALLACGGDESDDVANEDPKSSQSGMLVRRIDVYDEGRDPRQWQVIQFVYGDNNRVIAADYWGIEHVCGPVGARVHYIVSGNVLSLMFSQPTSDKNLQQGYNGEGFGQGILNSMGLLEEDYIDAHAYDIESGKYSYCVYEHNEKGQLTKMESHGSGIYVVTTKYTWDDDCLAGVSGSLYPGMPSKIAYTNYENKTNIDLNWLIYDQIFYEDIFGYTLCGYMTTKNKYLTSAAEWTFDAEGYPISCYDGKHYYDISY